MILKVSPDVVDIRLFCCIFVACVYIYINVRLVMSSHLLFCCIYFDARCITCCPKRKETREVVQNKKKLWIHRVISEVSVLGLLLVYKIPYSSCIKARWCMPIILPSIWYTVVACHIYSWFLPMSWILDLIILLSIRRAYKYMFRWLCRATCSVLSTSMLVVSHVQNENKLWKFTQCDGWGLVLGLLVVVCKIPYSSCMFNTAVVLEPGKM